jgi:DNA-binding NarL/FixJ family response regulator
MPGKNGLDVIKEIHRQRPSLPVLVLSMHPESELAPRLLKAGIAGYLMKESATAELVGAIRKIHAGGRYVSPALAEKLAGNLAQDSGRLPHEALSDREYQVLLAIASGKTAQDVATELSISVKTVRTYRDRIMEKLSLTNDVELSRYTIDNQLLPR